MKDLPCHSTGMKTNNTPSRSQFAVLRQICNLIPSYLTPKLARECGVDKKARTYSPRSHLVSLIYAQLTHAIGLNDLCDALRLHSGLLVTLRAATAPLVATTFLTPTKGARPISPKRFSGRCWAISKLSSRSFARGQRGKGVARRFRRAIHVVDSTTIQLIASRTDKGQTPPAQGRR